MAKCSIENVIGIELEDCLEQEEAQLLVDALVYSKLNAGYFHDMISSAKILTQN